MPSALARRLTRLRELAARSGVGPPLHHLAHRLREVARVGPLTLFPDVPSLAGRRALVVAHGPSLAALLPAILGAREQLYVIAPFRTALPLADAGVVPDVVVMAYPAAGAHEVCEEAWRNATAETRRRLTGQSTLLADLFAPPAILEHFGRVRVFDDGTGFLPDAARLPCWGIALVTALACALRLGAPAVAIAGVDLAGPNGRRHKDWTGRPVRLAPRMEVLHRLLGVLATAAVEFVDLSAGAVTKAGFTHESLADFLRRAAAPARPAIPPVQVAAGAVTALMLREAARWARAGRDMAEVAGRAVRLADSADPASRALLAEAVNQMERAWPVNPECQTVVRLLQPRYLRALWQLGPALKPLHNHTATCRKAKLVGGEFVDLIGAFEQSLEALRHAPDVHPAEAGA